MTIVGLWIPLITPFRNGELDETSLTRMIRHYAAQPVDGVILGATTGEGLSLSDEETDRIVLVARAELAEAKRQMPIFLGLSGGATVKVLKALHRTQMLAVDGYLIACPYYTRPSQTGLYQHFAQLAGNTDRPIVIYNIPYRTGVNLGNETMLRLAELPNIVGVKDCCADAGQSFDLLRHRPQGFSVLTGEDALFYTALTQGADGGILASAHVGTETLAHVRMLLRQGDQRAALAAWRAYADTPRLLFQEPNPAPIKHWLWRTGLIDSPELRLPMVPISDALAQRIDQHIEGLKARAAA
ncbi:4-hydroxy-tetrahydrodipicolinate synthase [Nordella sp. HKS 07]|uniref:4-hydroxy-tetrahydrodipicolinate synthase n=1 Tax=Nordella sp. HKS 07 TaxID=2712222 RepID=UPI001FF06CB7|nr:4-hydroxy-tetrahydrodipicolinate synthase [Nordella sp. HKS 07]